MRSLEKARDVTKHVLQTVIQNLDIRLYPEFTVVSIKGIRKFGVSQKQLNSEV